MAITSIRRSAFAGESLSSVDGASKISVERIEDTGIHAVLDADYGEGLIDDLPVRKVEGNIADGADDMNVLVPLTDSLDGIHDGGNAVLGSAEHLNQRIDE